MQSYKSTLLLAPQHIRFTTNHFDFRFKNIVQEQVQIKGFAKDKQKSAKMKDKYNAKALQKEFLKSEIKLLCSVYF